MVATRTPELLPSEKYTKYGRKTVFRCFDDCLLAMFPWMAAWFYSDDPLGRLLLFYLGIALMVLVLAGVEVANLRYRR